MMIVDGRVENVVKPAPYYPKIAAICRAAGQKVADNDFEKIDALLENDSDWLTFVRLCLCYSQEAYRFALCVRPLPNYFFLDRNGLRRPVRPLCGR